MLCKSDTSGKNKVIRDFSQLYVISTLTTLNPQPLIPTNHPCKWKEAKQLAFTDSKKKNGNMKWWEPPLFPSNLDNWCNLYLSICSTKPDNHP